MFIKNEEGFGNDLPERNSKENPRRRNMNVEL